MKAVIYARVSTEEQDTERQISELTKLANNEGYSVKSFIDKISGTTTAKTRKGFEDMLAYIQDNDIKQIYCWELSRLGRSMIDIYKNIQEFRTSGINVHIKKEGINTSVNDGNTQLQLNLLASIAEYERHTIKERTKSGTYNSIRKGGVGSGSIKQFGYKKENGKLIIDEYEKTVILDIVDKYLNKNWSVKQIADYLNESGIDTRIKKLVDSHTIIYNKKCKMVWTDGTVARLLHKKLLTGFRKYGNVELQDENFRIIDDATFNALQIKMEGKRKDNQNAQKFENILRGILVCANCGSTMIMHKGTSGLQNHYKCFERFVNKSNCSSAMINIDILNNQVYDLTKNFKVEAKDIANKIAELQDKIHFNNTSIHQIKAETKLLTDKEENLVDSLISGRIKPGMYDKKIIEITDEMTAINSKQIKLETLNINLLDEINELSNKKVVDLSNPIVFKSNIKSLIESIEVKTLNNSDLIKVNEMVKDFDGVYFNSTNRRNKVYQINIKMFDRKTVYVRIFNNSKNFDKIIDVN